MEKIKNLETHDHGVLFYRTSAHKHQVLFNFLDAGFNRDEGAVYVAGDETPKMIREAMLDFGFDVKGLEKEGKLKIVNYDRWYIVNGEFNVSNVIALWKKAYEEASEAGLKGLRACGEMDCFFRHNFLEELVEYEKICGRRFEAPVAALCAYGPYNVNLLERNLFFDIVKSHSHIFSPNFAGSFDLKSFYQRVIPEELEDIVGEMKARAILSFLNRWRTILVAEIDEPEDFHTVIKSLIGSRADQLEKQIHRRLYDKLGVEMPRLRKISDLF